MSKKSRKRIKMMVTVSVPMDMTAAEARKEVKTLIRHQANWSQKWDTDDIKTISVKPATRSLFSYD